jgi:hypothetical protein
VVLFGCGSEYPLCDFGDGVGANVAKKGTKKPPFLAVCEKEINTI